MYFISIDGNQTPTDIWDRVFKSGPRKFVEDSKLEVI